MANVIRSVLPSSSRPLLRMRRPRNLLGDLIFTSREIAGRDGVRAGLAVRSVLEKELETFASNVAVQVARHDRRAIALVKEFLARTEGLPAPLAPGLKIALY